MLVALGALSTGCASSRTGAARGDRNFIMRDQIMEHRFANAYEAVEALHSNWLRAKVTDSFQTPSEIRVYMDDTLLGGIETLRSINPNNIKYIQHFDGVSATARWGLDHTQGVILVMTHE